MKPVFSLFLIVAVLILAIPPATAQDSPKIPRIGILSPGGGMRPIPGLNPNHRALIEGLKELGYVDGKNILIERRSSKGKINLLTELAAELVRLNVAVIVPSGPTAVGPAMKATKTIPIVMPNGGNPVDRGFVKSLIRPGGNVTGLAGFAEGLNQKQIELLKETSSSVKRAVVLIPHRRRQSTGIAYKEAGVALGIDVRSVDFYKPEDFDGALAKIIAIRPDALITVQNNLTHRYASPIAQFALENRFLFMTDDRYFTDAGALLSYGVNYAANFRRAAVFVDKILKGADPATLPVEPAHLEFVINLQTARKLGVTIPPEILLEANEVIK